MRRLIAPYAPVSSPYVIPRRRRRWLREAAWLAVVVWGMMLLFWALGRLT